MVERVGGVGRLVGVSGLGRGGVSHWEGTPLVTRLTGSPEY